MRASRIARAGDAIAVPARVPLAAALATLTLLACAGPSGGTAGEAAADPPLTPGALRIRLVFDAAADLDLYVTGPSHETVYFANDASREGGRLEADRRCGSPPPRIETVVFAAPAPGTYRVGVDFMERCQGWSDEARYRLVVESPGRAPLEREGQARFGRFEPRVLELHLDASVP